MLYYIRCSFFLHYREPISPINEAIVFQNSEESLSTNYTLHYYCALQVTQPVIRVSQSVFLSEYAFLLVVLVQC